MLFLISLFIIVLIAVLDSSAASLIFGVGMYGIGAFLSLIGTGGGCKMRLGLYNRVFLIYFILAYIVSLSFNITDNFIVSDSSRYIDSYMYRTSFAFGNDDFIKCYLGLADNNFLYNAYLNVMAMFANTYLGEMTVFGMTLCQTIWGVLSSLVLFRILARHIDVNKALKYTMAFACCSLFLFYSTVIIRDIIICFLYLCAFDIIDQKFSVAGLVELVLIMLITWGIRLYSGVFLASFIAYYVYIRCRNSRLRYIATFFLMVVLLYAVLAIFSSSLMEQTVTELNGYEEFSAERSAGGVLSKLQSLPPGINYFSIVLYSMVSPLPPLGIYIGVNSFSNFIMATMCLIAGFFWFVVFYSLFYQLFIKKYISKFPFERILLLVICFVFMMANATHPDLRRMLPVYPILFVLFVDICKMENETLFGSRISKKLITLYIVLVIVLLPLI